MIVIGSKNKLKNTHAHVLTKATSTSLQKKNQIGITPLEYLEANPFEDIDQSLFMNRYVLEMIGEAV